MASAVAVAAQRAVGCAHVEVVDDEAHSEARVCRRAAPVVTAAAAPTGSGVPCETAKHAMGMMLWQQKWTEY